MKAPVRGLQLYLKEASAVFFLWNLQTFQEHPFYRTALVATSEV